MLSIEVGSLDVNSACTSTSGVSKPVGFGAVLQGGRLQFRVGCPGGIRKGGGRRGVVKQMSEQSRRRLMETFGSVDWDAVAASGRTVGFLTLTTPPEFWGRGEHVWRALEKLKKRLERLSNDPGALVRKELGAKRGMLHYHLVTIGIDVSERELSRMWTECLGASRPVRVEADYDTKAVHKIIKYLSKYCAKAAYKGMERDAPGAGTSAAESPNDAAGDLGAARALSKSHNAPCAVESEENQGKNGHRWWYKWGAKNIPMSETAVLRGASQEDLRRFLSKVRRVFRKWKEIRVKAAVRAQLLKSGCPRRLVDDMTRQFYKRWLSGKVARFLKGCAGFTFLGSQDLILQVLMGVGSNFGGSGGVWLDVEGEAYAITGMQKAHNAAWFWHSAA